MQRVKDLFSGRLFAVTAVVALGALFASGAASAGVVGTADPNLTSTINQVTYYFGDNIAVVIGGSVSIALLLWLVGMFFRGTGAKKKGV